MAPWPGLSVGMVMPSTIGAPVEGSSNARVFGSVVHGNDNEGSDLDILIDPTPKTSLMDVAKIQVELEALLGVKVDVLTPNALPEKFRHVVLAEALPV